jgi:hypothetical protein
MSNPPYTHLTIQPADDNGAHEVWGQFMVTYPGIGTCNSDGIIGFLYHLGPYWVFVNEVGHPTQVFAAVEELAGWLQAKAPSIDWAESYRQPEDRG